MRNRIEIEVWMKRNGVKVADIQHAVGFTNHGVVSNTIAGRKDNRKVLQYLLSKGCPARHLALPKGMRKAA
jgi:hypothetical protein